MVGSILWDLICDEAAKQNRGQALVTVVVIVVVSFGNRC